MKHINKNYIFFLFIIILITNLNSSPTNIIIGQKFFLEESNKGFRTKDIAKLTLEEISTYYSHLEVDIIELSEELTAELVLNTNFSNYKKNTTEERGKSVINIIFIQVEEKKTFRKSRVKLDIRLYLIKKYTEDSEEPVNMQTILFMINDLNNKIPSQKITFKVSRKKDSETHKYLKPNGELEALKSMTIKDMTEFYKLQEEQERNERIEKNIQKAKEEKEKLKIELEKKLINKLNLNDKIIYFYSQVTNMKTYLDEIKIIKQNTKLLVKEEEKQKEKEKDDKMAYLSEIERKFNQSEKEVEDLLESLKNAEFKMNVSLSLLNKNKKIKTEQLNQLFEENNKITKNMKLRNPTKWHNFFKTMMSRIKKNIDSGGNIETSISSNNGYELALPLKENDTIPEKVTLSDTYSDALPISLEKENSYEVVYEEIKDKKRENYQNTKRVFNNLSKSLLLMQSSPILTLTPVSID